VNLTTWTARTSLSSALGIVIIAASVSAPPLAAPPRPAPSRFSELVARGQQALKARDYPGAQEALSQAIALRPNDAVVRYALARAYGEDKKYQPASLHLKETLRLSPGHQPALCDLAAIEENSGRFTEASALYQQALKAGPSLSAQRGLAAILSLQGRTGESLAQLQRLVAAHPADGETRYALARALTQSGDCADAVPHFEAVIAKAPGHQGALFNLGNCLNRLGRAGEATAVHARFQQASREEAEFVDRRRRVYFLLLEADRKMEEGDLAAALADASEAIRIAPEDARPHAIRGQALDLRGDPTGALSAYRRAAEFDPTNAIVLVEVGRLLGGQGRFADALPWLTRAVKADPAMPEPHLLLAAVYHQTGRPAQAAAEEALYKRLLADRAQHP